VKRAPRLTGVSCLTTTHPEHVREFRAEEHEQRTDERRYRWAREQIAVRAQA